MGTKKETFEGVGTTAHKETDSERCEKCFEEEHVVGDENEKEKPRLSEYVAIAFDKKTQNEKKKELISAVVDRQHKLLVIRAEKKVIQKNHINAILYQAKFRAVHGEMLAMNGSVEPQLPNYFIAQCMAHFVAFVVILRYVLLIWPLLAKTILK